MNENVTKAQEKMQKCLNSLEHELSTVRAGRANPAVLDKVLVDYYGTPTPIQQMAAVSVSEARILVIQPWDKGQLKAIEKAILNSDIGITKVPLSCHRVRRRIETIHFFQKDSSHTLYR